MLPKQAIGILTIRLVLMEEEREQIPELSCANRSKNGEQGHDDRASAGFDGEGLTHDLAMAAIDPKPISSIKLRGAASLAYPFFTKRSSISDMMKDVDEFNGQESVPAEMLRLSCKSYTRAEIQEVSCALSASQHGSFAHFGCHGRIRIYADLL
jgi:hypothetical protein